MNKIILTSLILLSVLFGVLPAQEKASDIAKEIYQQNLVRFSCHLTEREAEDSARHFLRLGNDCILRFDSGNVMERKSAVLSVCVAVEIKNNVWCFSFSTI